MRGSGSGGESPDGGHHHGHHGGHHGHNMARCRPANSMEQDSFDSFDEMEDMLIAQTNNLRLSPNNAAAAASGEEDLPKSVIVTNVDLAVFDNEGIKANFETMFREFDDGALFHYLRSFRRIRVDFESHHCASKAKINLDSTPIGNNVIHCYLVQVLSPCTDEDAFLHVPPLQKQFLISPPCSPPVGWEQPRENRPIVDYDLIAAMAQLAPGEKHELHPTKQINVLGKSVSTPSIVVHIAEDDGGATSEDGPGLNGHHVPAGASFKRIKPTRCPDRQSSLD